MSDSEKLADRLEHLETRIRRLKRTGAVAAAVVFTALVLGQAVVVAALLLSQEEPELTIATVEATEFVLKDEVGTIRGRWGMLPGGGSALELIDQERKASVRCTVDPNGMAALQVTSIATGPDGKAGKAGIYCTVDAKGYVELALFDSHAKPRGMWTIVPEGDTLVKLYDGEGRTRSTWNVDAEGSAGFVIANEKDEVVFEAPEVVFEDP